MQVGTVAGIVVVAIRQKTERIKLLIETSPAVIPVHPAAQFGIVKIGETGNVKAISRKAWQKILFSTDDGEEAKLEDLVADKTKFNDTISEDNTTRIITKK